MSDIKASICMATFNRDPRVLYKVLKSIFIQKPPFKFEVIVCDDGSATGDARNVCQQFPVKYHRIDRAPVRRNPCVARNVAYRAALGDVIIAQSDDVMHVSPNSIGTLVAELAIHPTSFIIASVFGCGPNGSPWSVYTGYWNLPKWKVGQRRLLPYFFLGALRKVDLYAIGGNDEEFVNISGYEDQWFSDCLMQGLKLTPVYTASVIGHHLYHPSYDTKAKESIAKIFYARKKEAAVSTGTWKSAGGAWPCDGVPMKTEQAFEAVYKELAWGGHEGETSSGAGSTLEASKSLRMAIPNIMNLCDASSILDIPCGDFHWMQHVAFNGSYIGADIVRSLIEKNLIKYNKDFRHLDLITSDLPEVDLVFCRDCLGHLSLADGLQAMRNVKKSGSKYFMATTFWNHRGNIDITTGKDWATRCLVDAPYNFPPPLLTVDEMCLEFYPKFFDKSMALWRISDLKV